MCDEPGTDNVFDLDSLSSSRTMGGKIDGMKGELLSLNGASSDIGGSIERSTIDGGSSLSLGVSIIVTADILSER